MRIRYTICVFVLLFCHSNFSLSQGITTMSIGPFSSGSAQSYCINPFSISYNSYHWQAGGALIVEVFQDSFNPAYAKYVVNVGYGFGANYGNKEILLIEQTGDKKFTLDFGVAYQLFTQTGGHENYGLPILLKMKPYILCKLRVTYTRNLVNQLLEFNELQVHENPTLIPIEDFSNSTSSDLDLWTSKNLRVEGAGNHYIKDGNVGIGTAIPNEKLSVNGNIRAKEIKVETANWPDYVFKQDYPLQSLTDLSKYIKENGHLPDVPIASEVESNGVSLGEMNKILLKKVEELTLYVIDLQNQLIELKVEKK